MKMKKFFVLMMAMVMCLGLLAGCGQDAGDEATDAPTSEAPRFRGSRGLRRHRRDLQVRRHRPPDR